jgi:hypothetical protein
MKKEYSKDQIWEFYDKLSSELKEAVFSMETANNIFDICIRNGIEDDRVSEVARYTGRVLLGILSAGELQETLEKEVKLKKEAAKKVTQEIDRLIFYPVKPALDELYKTGESSKTKPLIEKAIPPEATPPEEKPSTPSGSDTYRESIE